MPEAERKGFPDLIDPQTEADLFAMQVARELNCSAMEALHQSPHWINSVRTEWDWRELRQKRQH